jgi:hypothetical protein
MMFCVTARLRRPDEAIPLCRIALAPVSLIGIFSAMRRSKEIVVLLALLVGAMAFVLWYVIDRRAKNRALEPAASGQLAPNPAAVPASSDPVALPVNEPVALGTPVTERKTIDFTSGQPVVKDSPEDKAALDAALKEMAEASKGVTFGPAPKQPAEKSQP